MGNPLDVKFSTMSGTETTLRELGDSDTAKWVVVNVASACGFTRQYTQLQEISERSEIMVVGFPCNQFGGQEPGTHEEICEFTSSKYNVNFPLMAKLAVKGEHQHPLFELLCQSTGKDGSAGDIRWNFEKFVVSKDGTVSRHSSADSPLDIV